MAFESGYKFLFKSEVGENGRRVIDMTKENMSIWKRVLLIDDIFEMDSYGEITFSDISGLFSDHLISGEGLKVDTKLGNIEDGFIEHNYYIINNTLVKPNITTHISGDITIMVSSLAELLDHKRSFAWKDTISNVVRDLAKNVLQIPEKKIFIEETTGVDIWYQANITGIEFIKDLADIAYSNNKPNSPFFTFINCNNEFYFMTMDKLFDKNPINPDYPYKLEFTTDQSYKAYGIKDFLVNFTGVGVNKDNYKKKIYKTLNNGKVESSLTQINEHITKGRGDLLIRKDLVDSFPQTDILDFGIYEKETDVENYKGFINAEYRDSSLYMRMEITIPFNHKAVTGNTIDLQLGSVLKEKAGRSQEYTGKWLIIGSKHFFDSDQQPFSELLIAKGRVEVDPDHPFKKSNLK